MRTLGLLLALLLPLSGRAEEITIAAAADLQYAMQVLIDEYRRSDPGTQIRAVYGSSGTFNAQIAQGAPFDLYFSADISYPQALHASGLAASEVVPYARGRLVLWSAREDVGMLSWTDLQQERFRRIAIANPLHAPYGKRAEEVLQALGLLDSLRTKLVLGDNIAQTLQFVQTGSADIGIVALSLVAAPALRGKGWYQLVPEDLHAPLLQGFIVTRRAADNAAARRFAAFMATTQAQDILSAYGFVPPTAGAAASHE